MEEIKQEYYLNKLNELNNEIYTIHNDLYKLCKLLHFILWVSAISLLLLGIILNHIN